MRCWSHLEGGVNHLVCMSSWGKLHALKTDAASRPAWKRGKTMMIPRFTLYVRVLGIRDRRCLVACSGCLCAVFQFRNLHICLQAATSGVDHHCTFLSHGSKPSRGDSQNAAGNRAAENAIRLHPVQVVTVDTRFCRVVLQSNACNACVFSDLLRPLVLLLTATYSFTSTAKRD